MTDNQTKPVIKIGDWIRYYNNGQMRLAIVQYIQKQKHYPWQDEALTDSVPVAFDAILEVRHSND